MSKTSTTKAEIEMRKRTEEAMEALDTLYEYAKIGAPTWIGLGGLNGFFLALKGCIEERASFRHTISILVDENEKEREIYLRRLRTKNERVKQLEERLRSYEGDESQGVPSAI